MQACPRDWGPLGGGTDGEEKNLRNNAHSISSLGPWTCRHLNKTSTVHQEGKPICPDQL